MEHLAETDEGGWTRLVISRPVFKNALNTALLGGIAAALRRLADQPDCRAVLIHGSQGNFAAGADIAEIEAKTTAEGASDPRKGHWAAIRAFPKPLIAAVDGFALGGGLELAFMADLMVVGDTARLAMPETGLGLIPGAGGGQRLIARIGAARTARMVLTGEVIDADTAFSWGLASHRALDAVAEGEVLAARLADRAPLALMAAKSALVAGAEAALALDRERMAFEALLDTNDKREGILAFREKRKARFQGQ